MSKFFVANDDKYLVPDQEEYFLVPETTVIQRLGITWAFARSDNRIIYERTAGIPLQRAEEVRVFERPPEQLEFQGGTP